MPFDGKHQAVTPLQFLAEVRSILGPNGERWSKRHYGPSVAPCAPHCLVGAMDAACHVLSKRAPRGDDTADQAMDIVHLTVQRYCAPGSIERFNDHPHTTWPEIVAILDKAEASLTRGGSHAV
jgi:hypothetical protein